MPCIVAFYCLLATNGTIHLKVVWRRIAWEPSCQSLTSLEPRPLFQVGEAEAEAKALQHEHNIHLCANSACRLNIWLCLPKNFNKKSFYPRLM